MIYREIIEEGRGEGYKVTDVKGFDFLKIEIIIEERGEGYKVSDVKGPGFSKI